MPHVSKKELSKKSLDKINQQLFEVIKNLKSNKRVGVFTGDFFTESEKLMFAKRLALIFMISEHVPFLVIERTLKVSSSTINRFAVEIDRGGYSGVLKEIEKKKTKELLWNELEFLLRIGMPKYGKGRWADFYKRTGKRTGKRI